MRYIGIDVAKDTFDVAFPSSNSNYKVVQFVNNEEGVKKFIKKLKQDDRSVLEATGSYSTLLTKRIMESGFEVSVVNPLQTKYFSKMTLRRTKTDASDAEMIAEYGLKMSPEPEKPTPDYIDDMRQRRAVLSQLKETVVRFKNQLHAMKARVRPDKTSIKFIEETIANLQMQIDELEKNMQEVVKEKASKSYESLVSIPGIGKLSAIELIAITSNFENFTNYKQLSAYVGLCPRISESGTSVKGKSSLSKMGMSSTRQLLYMCSMAAIKCNKSCKEMFKRLIENGKHRMVALMAVANKLVKIAFTIVKKGELYDDKKVCFS